ncbi:hypothetical protein L7F22_011699 [Adiantum nelumboides]|nr:hypothetical protein [Adiantum nelumboides]
MADNNIDVFKMFAAEDRLDGDNYPIWAYMMQHVLVSKGIWNIVQGIDVRPGSVDVAEVVDVAGPSTRIIAASSTESTLYVKREGDVLLIVVLYVDDLLITGTNEGHIAEFKADLNATFKMKDLGLLHHYLGIQFKQCDGGIALCEKSYIETLLYIQFAVSQVSRFMHSRGSKHWHAVKRIFCYLSGTLHLGLFYPKGGSLPPDLHAFSDSDWAGCFDTRVSTSGFCFMLGSSCISWLSKKQPTVATSSCEAEYRAIFIAMVECVWLRRLMADLVIVKF